MAFFVIVLAHIINKRFSLFYRTMRLALFVVCFASKLLIVSLTLQTVHLLTNKFPTAKLLIKFHPLQ